LAASDSGLRPPDSGLPFGLTGGIACGKSTVANYFQELGAYIIDADRLGHESIEPGHPAYQQIVHYFGKEILAADGTIDRKKLGARVFADPQQLQALNAIVHPRIIARTRELTAQEQSRSPHAVIIVDAALIFEAGIAGTVRKVIVAWCRPEQQLDRLMAKTGIPRGEAQRRIEAQIPVEKKRRRADYVIDCSRSLAETRLQVEELFPRLQALLQ
jgi:dephospho-CoA kinase